MVDMEDCSFDINLFRSGGIFEWLINNFTFEFFLDLFEFNNFRKFHITNLRSDFDWFCWERNLFNFRLVFSTGTICNYQLAPFLLIFADFNFISPQPVFYSPCCVVHPVGLSQILTFLALLISLVDCLTSFCSKTANGSFFPLALLTFCLYYSPSFSVTGAPIKKDAEIIREIADNSIFFICFN